MPSSLPTLDLCLTVERGWEKTCDHTHWCHFNEWLQTSMGRFLLLGSHTDPTVLPPPTFLPLKLQHLPPHPHSQLMTSSFLAEKLDPPPGTCTHSPKIQSPWVHIGAYASICLLAGADTNDQSLHPWTRPTLLFTCSSTYLQGLSLTHVINFPSLPDHSS